MMEPLMLDLSGIVFSTGMMLLVIFRAMKLDREQPWFQTVKIEDTKPGANKRPWQR
jgi:hypothetical protein